MKRKGFTLSELLITLSVVAIIGVLLTPQIINLLPDNDKVKVIKVYNTINSINNELFNDPTFYRLGTLIDGTTTKCNKILACTAAPLDSAYASYKGSNKYPFLLRDKLVLSSSNNYTFNTVDGLTLTLSEEGSNNTLKYVIQVDTNTNRQKCTYDKTSCKNPGLFKFKLDTNGVLKADDPLTNIYLQNPLEFNDRSGDLQKASEYTQQNEINTNYDYNTIEKGSNNN